MSLPPLKINFDADTGAISSAVDNVAQEMEKLESATKRIGRGVQNFGSQLQGAGRRMLPVSGAVAGTATAMFGLAASTAKAGNEIAKTARSTGFGQQALQELQFAIGQASDVTEGEFTKGLQSLNRRMDEAANGNERYAESFDKIGVSVEDIQDGTVSTEDVFNKLNEALQETESASEAAGIASDLLGSRLGRQLGPQLREVGGDLEGLRDRFNDLGLAIDDDTIAQSEQAIDQMSELRQQFSALGRIVGAAMLPALMSLGDTMQETVIPAITRGVEHITNMIDWFSELPEGVQTAAGAIAAALGTGGPVLIALGTLTKVIGGLIAATGPIGLFIAAATALYAAWQIWGDDIIALFDRVSKWISGIVDDIKGAISSGFNAARDTAMRTVNRLTTGVQNLFGALPDGVQSSLREMGEGIMNVMRGYVRLFTSVITGDWRGAVDAFKGLFQDIPEAIGKVFDAVVEIIKAIIPAARSALSELPDIAITSFANMAEAAVDAIGVMRQWIMERMQGIVAALKEIPAQMMEVGRDIIRGLWNGLKEAWDNFSITDTVRGWGTGMVDAISEAVGRKSPATEFYAVGEDIVAGLNNGIRDHSDESEELMRGLGTRLRDAFRGSEEEEESQFRQLGMHAAQGTAEGVQAGAPSAVAAVEGMARDMNRAMSVGANAMQQTTSGMVSDVLGSLGQLFEGNKAIAAAQAIVNTMQGITEALKLPFPASLAAAAQVAARGAAALAGIRSSSPGGNQSMPNTSRGGGGGGSMSSGASATTSAQQQAPTTTFQFTLQNDPMGFGEQFARQMIEQLNEASANGGRVRGVLV